MKNEGADCVKVTRSRKKKVFSSFDENPGDLNKVKRERVL